ncbi:hypothetical protein [Myroides injenensis]|uniref:hypothetical protein n=1 Tax=Myroides injenensis TaxID=1183151 RepID=UPI0002895311|nr:hypothetical protein [Myroides injenensis]
MANYFCEYCGSKFANIQSLTACSCRLHPLGQHKGKHKLYEGGQKAQYFCKYCGAKFSALTTLTNLSCQRHPQGQHKGKHSPAL